MQTNEKKKIFFASDFHLGVDTGGGTTKEREESIVRWLELIEAEAKAIYLLGDLFDFWFEYGTVVPRGYILFLGKLLDLRRKGIEIYVFTGNHDMWMFDYFEKELDIPVYRKPIEKKLYGKRFFLGHGDGLGPGDRGYKILKRIFANRLCQWAFARIHPNFGIGLARFWSGKSRSVNPAENQFLGAEKEWLLQYCNKKIKEVPADFFIFGHRHLPMDCTLDNKKSRYINLGEWMHYNSYAVFDGTSLELKYFEKKPFSHTILR